MNEWGIYIALYCVLLYTQSALQSYEGVSPQPPPVCSIHLEKKRKEKKKERKEKKVPYFKNNTQTCTVHSYIKNSLLGT